MDLPGENPADVGSASPATPPAIRVSASAHEVPGGAAAAGSHPPSSSRALRAVAKRFVGAYYDHLNASPSRVARYYTEDSVFTVEDGSTPTPRGRTGKQSGNEPENQQRDEEELDFHDSGPESPMRRLLATAPSASGTDGIIARRQRCSSTGTRAWSRRTSRLSRGGTSWRLCSERSRGETRRRIRERDPPLARLDAGRR